MTRSPP